MAKTLEIPYKERVLVILSSFLFLIVQFFYSGFIFIKKLRSITWKHAPALMANEGKVDLDIDALQTTLQTVQSSRIQRLYHFTSYVVFVWKAALLKSLSAMFMFLFGRDYRQAMYGKRMKRNNFILDKNITFTNHGSYGTVPKRVLEARQQFQDEFDRCPDGWFRYKAQNLWNESLRTVAKFVRANFNDCVFVPNATSGINTVLWCLGLCEGDGILITSQTYGAIQMAAQEVCRANKAKLLVLNITFPTSDMTGSVNYQATEIVQHYEKVLQENPSIKIAIIDAITSTSAVKLPFKRITEVCHHYNVLVLVDGAHAPGQIPLDLERLGADFFVGNLHKWLFAPRGCAILWVSPKFHDIIVPLVVSWMHDRSLQDRFYSQGTIDHSAYISAGAAIKFYSEVGGMSPLTKYNSQLVRWASTMLAEAWNTEVLPIPESMRAPFMAVIRLPQVLTASYGATKEGEKQIMEDVFYKYNVVTTFVSIQASLWCRISAQIYNAKEDYLVLAESVLKLMQECQNGFHPKVEKAFAPNRWSWHEAPHAASH